ncbi:MAG TPA: hypothetical protein VFF33_13180 [Ignavibacteriaceae bacterium]|nr:hypothetical protein [Ignavibacteriaceae bacterium]
MYVIRDVFKVKFGRMKEVMVLVKEGESFMREMQNPNDRILTDFTGEYYTLVMETHTESLSDFEKMMSQTFADNKYEEWYKKFIPLVDRGYREILKVVDLKK